MHCYNLWCADAQSRAPCVIVLIDMSTKASYRMFVFATRIPAEHACDLPSFAPSNACAKQRLLVLCRSSSLLYLWNTVTEVPAAVRDRCKCTACQAMMTQWLLF